jgi:hypothetical protein
LKDIEFEDLHSRARDLFELSQLLEERVKSLEASIVTLNEQLTDSNNENASRLRCYDDLNTRYQELEKTGEE